MSEKPSEEVLTRWQLEKMLRNHPYVDKYDIMVAGGLVGSRDKIPEFMDVYHKVLSWMPHDLKTHYNQLRISTLGEVLMEYAMMQEKAKLTAEKV